MPQAKSTAQPCAICSLMNDAMQRFEQTYFSTIEGVRYAWRSNRDMTQSASTRQRPSLVMLHGFTGSSLSWWRCVELMNPRVDCFAIDIIGHGQSDAPIASEAYRFATAVDHMTTLIAELVESPVNLLGYSMGGRLALSIARRAPHLFSQLVLESSSPGLKTEAERHHRVEQDELLARYILTHPIEDFVHRWTDLPLWNSQSTLPASQRDALYQQRLSNTPAGLAGSLQGMGTGIMPHLWHELDTILHPALLLTGEHDTKFTVINHEMKAHLPHAVHNVIPDAGHMVHFEQPEVYAARVLEFITP